MTRFIAAHIMRATGLLLIAATFFANVIVPTRAESNAPVYADLTHLVYTATGPLSASFVSPAPGEASAIGAATVTASTIKGAGIELSVNGETVPYKQLGKRTVNVKTGETQYFFYGVPLKPGPNTLAIVPLGADNARGAAVTETVFGPGAPASLYADFAAPLLADGKTPAIMRVWVRDQYSHPAIAGARLTATILRGNAAFANPDAPSAMPTDEPMPASPLPSPRPASGTQNVEQTLAPGGYSEIRIIPGTLAGPLEIEIDAGDARLRKTFYLEPYVRKPFVTGLISAGAGAVPGGVDGDARYDEGASRRERVALYASGQVGKHSLLTLAYESQNRLSPVSSYGAFVQDPNERPYLTYGDASSVASPLHSRDRLYARIENGRNSLMWGQFDAAIGSTDLGSFHQLLSGAQVTLGDRNERVSFTGFTARNDTAFISQALPVLGLGALMQPLHPNIVVGSDYVQLVALDRRTGAIISQTPLTRNLDYTIDYATGTLRFINVPLPYDQNFNPQTILLQYQYQGPGVLSQTTGAGLGIALTADKKTALQLGYVNDTTGTRNFALSSEALTRQWEGGSWSFSHASAHGAMPDPNNPYPTAAGGDAISFLLSSHALGNQVDLSFQDTGGGFSNPFGGLSTPGLLAYHVGYTRSLPQRFAVTLSADGQRYHGIGQNDSQSNQNVLVHWFASKQLSFLAGLVRHDQRSGGALPSPAPSAGPFVGTQSQTQARLGMEYKASKRVSVTLEQYQTIAGSDAGSTQPSQTLAQFGYDMPGHGRVYLRELWSAAPAMTFANAASGITLGSGATHSLQLGMERELSPATTISSDYVVSGTGDARNIYSALGVQERFKFFKNLAGNLIAQSANAIGQGAQGFTTWGGALAYANPQTLRASLAYQGRSGFAGGSTLSSGIAGRISPDISIVAFAQRAYSPAALSIDDKATLALRPSQNDRLVSLFTYERSNGGFNTAEVSNVVSLEQLFRPTESLEVAGRFAFKLDGDGYYEAHTSLWSLRARQGLGPRFDIGTEARMISVPVNGARSVDFAVESGYAAGSTARIAVGYSFSGSDDPTLTGRPQRRGVYLTVTSLIDRFFGWGKQP